MDSFDGSQSYSGSPMEKMWGVNRQLEQSLDIVEADQIQIPEVGAVKGIPALMVLRLAYQSLGIVYGDLGTSPLYVFRSTFPNGIDNDDNVMGVLSCIIYSLALIPLIKYTFIVMWANDHGEGGTFALYSLICRHVKVNAITNRHSTDKKLPTYSKKKFDKNSLAWKIKKWLEAKGHRQTALVVLVIFGTSMVIGDGILTPAISVLSSVSGIKVNYPGISNGLIVGIACIILVGLFLLQRFGTEKVGWLFAPVVSIWFLSIGTIGLYNIIKYKPSVFRAFSPIYLVEFFVKNPRDAWSSLGGVVLSITGTEALYADISFFPVSSIQIAFTVLVFPCLLSAYMGQAAYLIKFPDHVDHAFYRSIPKPVYWPMFVISTLSAIIASQAIISATFSIIKQAQALGCFPRVKVVHTSAKISGQVYIPEINWMLMILCIIITAGFRDTTQIGNAYGSAVVLVMLVTTILMTLIMLLVWRINILLISAFTCFFVFVELVYFSSVLFKLNQGGWVPLVIAINSLVVMYVWHYGTLKRYEFEMYNKVSIRWILGLDPTLGLERVPGIGFIYTELAHGLPSIFFHFVTHLPALHSVVVFVCIKYLPVSKVPSNDRFLIKRIGLNDFFMYRCVVRYGYTDLHKRDDNFEQNMMDQLVKYVTENSSSKQGSAHSCDGAATETSTLSACTNPSKSDTLPPYRGCPAMPNSIDHQSGCQTTLQQEKIDVLSDSEVQIEEDSDVDEVHMLSRARGEGTVHILGDIAIRARPGSHFFKRLVIDYLYAFMRRICRENSATLSIPHESLFSIGQVYFV